MLASIYSSRLRWLCDSTFQMALSQVIACIAKANILSTI